MKVFISVPMNGRDDDEVKKEMNKGIAYLEYIHRDEKVEMIETFIDLGDVPRLVYLGRSIQLMADADLVLFMPGWDEASGCLVEHDVALRYGIKRMYFKEEL